MGAPSGPYFRSRLLYNSLYLPFHLAIILSFTNLAFRRGVRLVEVDELGAPGFGVVLSWGGRRPRREGELGEAMVGAALLLFLRSPLSSCYLLLFRVDGGAWRRDIRPPLAA